MEIPELIFSLFNVEVKSASLDIFLRIESHFNKFYLEAKLMYTFKGIGYYWMNEKKIQSFYEFSKFVYGGISILPCALFIKQTNKHFVYRI